MKDNFYSLFFAFLLCILNVGHAQQYPIWFSQKSVVNNLNSPTALAFAADGRIFVAEQAGALRVIKNDSLLPQSFVKLSVNSVGERGLLGIALDPSFPTNGYIYLYHTLPDASRNRISRFTASGDTALAGSDTIILDLDPLSSAINHNGGAMQFGKDGKLYIAIGENASPSKAQNLDTYHGKLLRINADGSAPTDNPFPSGSAQKQRVWAYGLRNPYTFDIERYSGKIFVNDVGQNTWEEINDATTGGLNFGWPTAEGMSTDPLFANPVFTYSHGSGDGKGCAITGGTFFDPDSTNYPDSVVGAYFYQDYCNNWINYITFDSVGKAVRHPFATGLPNYSLSLETGNDGNLYFLNRTTRELVKILYSPQNPPSITSHPQDITISELLPVVFNVFVSGTSPFTFQWYKNDTMINGATSQQFTIEKVGFADAGKYYVTVENEHGIDTSNTATLTVTSFNNPPAATIQTPSDSVLYKGGQSFSFSGTGTDAEDGPLPDSAFQWNLVFYHDTHFHDGPPVGSGVKGGSFTLPNIGEVASNVYYKLFLLVKDSQGATDTTFITLLPLKSILNFATVPEGLTLTLDGQNIIAPYSVEGVAGMVRELGIVQEQVVDQDTFVFEKWLHGGTNIQNIITPDSDFVYTAIFKKKLVGSDSTPTAIEDESVIIFPNPAQEYLFLHGIDLNTQVTFCDISGKVVLTGMFTDNRIDISGLPLGIYYLYIPSAEGLRVMKIVKNKI